MMEDEVCPDNAQTNFGVSVECLLREIHYLTSEPLNCLFSPGFLELVPLLKHDRVLR